MLDGGCRAVAFGNFLSPLGSSLKLRLRGAALHLLSTRFLDVGCGILLLITMANGSWGDRRDCISRGRNFNVVLCSRVATAGRKRLGRRLVCLESLSPLALLPSFRL